MALTNGGPDLTLMGQDKPAITFPTPSIRWEITPVFSEKTESAHDSSRRKLDSRPEYENKSKSAHDEGEHWTEAEPKEVRRT